MSTEKPSPYTQALKIGVRVFAPMIYIPNEQHLAFLASVAVFWPGSTFLAIVLGVSRAFLWVFSAHF
jgi:hypothetical protein